MGISGTRGCRGTPDKVPAQGGPPDGTRKVSREGARPPPFRAVLHERRPRPRSEENDPAPAVVGSATFETAAPSGARGSPTAVAPAGAGAVVVPARILVGEGRHAAEARIELRSGVLAGTSIHLVTDAAGIRLRLSAASEAAHGALAAVIDRARLRLGTRGIVVRAERVVESGEKLGHGSPDRERGT